MPTFSAQIANFTRKVERNLDLIVKDAAQTTVAAMTERQPSVRETGGSFEIGKVPVDTGFLINSLTTALNGGGSVVGADAYAAVIAGMDLGDTVQAAFTAPYARVIEYGTGSMPGRFFVREAVAGWQAAVDAAVVKFGDA